MWGWVSRNAHRDILQHLSGLYLRECTKKLIFLFLNRNICCGYSKEPSQWDGSFEHSNKCSNWWLRKYLQFYTQKFCLSKPMICIPLMHTLANRDDPDEMLHFMAFYQGLHCLLKKNYLEIKLKIYNTTFCTVKPVLSSHSKINKTKILMTNGSLMKVESIAECYGAFCNTFDLH